MPIYRRGKTKRSKSQKNTTQSMKLNVKESSIICPNQETPKERHWLSNLDLFHERIHLVPLVYLYKPDGSSNFFDTKVLKKALSKVTVAFYPIAGRLGRDENGRLEIVCNGEGVLFREAETDFSMDELGHFIPNEKIKLLVPAVDPSSPISSYPLFVAQVTRFKCGGVCLGMGVHHLVMDGTAALHFINTWSDVARGFSIAVPPLMDRTILRSRNPPNPTFNHIEYAPPPTLKTPTNDQPETNVLQSLHLTTDPLNSLKSKAYNIATQTRYSTFEILTAHIWKCVCKARKLPDDQETKLCISVNGRTRLNPPIPPGYFGNVMFHARPVASCGDIVSESLTQTTDRLHREIKRRDDEYLRSAIDYLEVLDDLKTAMHGPETMHSPNLKIISLAKLPFKEADFGWGGPLNIRASTPVEGKGHILPSLTEDGGLSLVICLPADHMKLFQKFFYEVVLRSTL